MFNGETSCLQRAYELARTGQFETIAQIKAQLRRESYASIEATLCGSALTRALDKICAESWPG